MPGIEISSPPWQVREWFNTDSPLSLAGLRGRVVVLHAFQMLCPGCVLHGLPQTQRIRETFPPDEVAVIGLHTVFEHHEAMGPEALRAFIHEFRWSFPIGIDTPSADGPVPQTMAAYRMQGTPSLLLFDCAGRLRRQRFGQLADMGVGAEIMALVAESRTGSARAQEAPATAAGCRPPG